MNEQTCSGSEVSHCMSVNLHGLSVSTDIVRNNHSS